MTTTIPGIAKLVGKDRHGGNIWAVDGRMLDDEQFDALLTEQVADLTRQIHALLTKRTDP
jgi:hypothetical protein